MTHLSFREADFHALAALWNEFYPPEFLIDAELLRLNTVGSPLFDWSASLIVMEGASLKGFIAVKKSPTPMLYPGARVDQAHINSMAFRYEDIGRSLIASAKGRLQGQGIHRLVFGQDSRHFFPGCPDKCTALRCVLDAAGFVEDSQCFDVQRDLEDYELRKPQPVGPEFRLLRAGELEAMERFLDREFSPRWRYDAMHKAEVEGSGSIVGLFIDGDVQGFAVIQDWRHLEPIGGAVWRSALGMRWGSLGPIGVAETVRGGGLGGALLGASLMILKDAGVHQCIIDWTSLVDFYAKHGFKPTRSYHGMSLSLG